MADQFKCEIMIAMNEDGDFVVVPADDDPIEKMSENYGFTTLRVAKLIVAMTPPVVPEVEVSIPDDAGETVHAEAEEVA